MRTTAKGINFYTVVSIRFVWKCLNRRGKTIFHPCCYWLWSFAIYFKHQMHNNAIKRGWRSPNLRVRSYLRNTSLFLSEKFKVSRWKKIIMLWKSIEASRIMFIRFLNWIFDNQVTESGVLTVKYLLIEDTFLK